MIRVAIVLLFYCALLNESVDSLAILSKRKSYESAKLLRTYPKSKEQQIVIRSRVLHKSDDCQILKEPRILGRAVDILCLDPQTVAEASKHLEANDIAHEVINDLKIDDQLEPETKEGHLSFEKYPSYDEITDYMKRIAKNHPDFVILTEEGETYEGRKLYLLKIGQSLVGDRTKAVYIDAGIHAREWIAPITSLYIIDRLVDRLSRGEDDVRTDVDYYIFPLLNPDGYEYSRLQDRMWRKNRAPPPSRSTCYGVDLNRNYDVVGYGVGATRDPCKETYQGAGRNTEPEVIAATNVVMRLKDVARVSLSFHSYGQLWLTSWGYKSQLPVDNDKMVRLGQKAAEAIKASSGREYTVGAAGLIFYPAGGASDDFAKAKAHIPYAVTIELPDRENGRHGFQLPASQIRSVGEEMWAAMKSVAEAALAEPLGRDVSASKEVARDKKEAKQSV